MATRKDIIELPDKRLRERSRKVGLINDKVRKLIEDMRSATLDWEEHRKHEVGVALAAVQLGEKFKILIIRNNFDDRSDKSFQVFINPKIIKKYGEKIEDFEGCLSIKGIYGKVPRYNKVRIKAQDSHGDEIILKAEGFLARVLQHEIDHMQGKLFIDYIKNDKEAFFSLEDDGKLKPIDYEKQVKKNRILWQ